MTKKFLFFKVILILFLVSCSLYETTVLTVRLTGTENLIGAQYEVGAYTSNNITEGIIGGYIGTVTDTTASKVLKEVSDNTKYSPSAPNRAFFVGEQVYIGGRVMYDGVLYESEPLKPIKVTEDCVVTISISEMIEKEAKPED